MRLSGPLLVGVLLPAVAVAQDINISKCQQSAKRQIYLSNDMVAVVRTYAGPSAAILLVRSAPTEVAYVWRYRASDRSATTSDRASLNVDDAKERAKAERPLMDVGSFVIEWNLDDANVSSLFYCPTLALVLYYPKSEFGRLPPTD